MVYISIPVRLYFTPFSPFFACSAYSMDKRVSFLCVVCIVYKNTDGTMLSQGKPLYATGVRQQTCIDDWLETKHERSHGACTDGNQWTSTLGDFTVIALAHARCMYDQLASTGVTALTVSGCRSILLLLWLPTNSPSVYVIFSWRLHALVISCAPPPLRQMRRNLTSCTAHYFLSSASQQDLELLNLSIRGIRRPCEWKL